MKFNRLVTQYQKENGEISYKMATYEIDVIAKSTGGLAPTILYFHDNRDVTDDVRAIRFGLESPYKYIEDYDAFQKMLYKKEQRAVNDLYDTISIRPKNMSTTKQVLWSFGVLLLMTIPLLVAFILK
ncbi:MULTISPECIES: sodium:proton antiporter [Lysinibacillus]|uniref:Sodium:proton antiporter n=1 Tax=Lysinibacillus antri TaxID=2498145 RepID=A0A432L878_9BACI|nr:MULTISPECIES: sodium:proton antiporter [Lysinibacillus]RUL48269.1 sodium:proton antiporter [Lysinibacillus antri]TSI11690.1 sodium:proton antiporter [Lysinibacillus sp. BW-2-10]